MSENIVKLRVDGKDFDNNIKSARQGLLAMEQACRKVGGTLEVVEKDELEFVRALGKMETTSKSAKGKISELTSAFTDLKAQYNRLTNEEKKGEFGKALNQSLNELKGRIQDGNVELKKIQGEIPNTNGVLDQLASKFGLNVGQMTKFAAVGATVTTALKVSKDAFFANEEQLDEWGRCVQSAGQLYDGFLTALNTGDISGYLSNIGQIINSARDAYDAMDALGTFKAFNQRNELIGRNNFLNAINNFREGKGSKADVKAAADAYIKELQKRQTLESSNYAAQIRSVAKAKGVDAKELTKILTGDYASYEKAKSVQMTGQKQQMKFLGPGQYTTETVKYAQNDAEKMGEALRMFNDTALQEIQRIGTEEIQTSIEIEGVRKQMLRATGQTGKKDSKSSKSSPKFYADPQTLKELNTNISYYSDQVKNNGTEEDNALISNIQKWKEKAKAIQDAIDKQEDEAKAAKKAAEEQAKKLEKDNKKIQEDLKKSGQLTRDFNSATARIATPTVGNGGKSIGDQYTKGQETKEDRFQRLISQYDQLSAAIEAAKVKNVNSDGAIIDPTAIDAASQQLASLKSQIEELGPVIQANLNFDHIVKSINNVGSAFSQIDGMVSSVESLANSWANAESAMDYFHATMQTVTTALNIFTGIMTAINAVQQISTAMTIKSTAAKAGEAVATGAQAATGAVKEGEMITELATAKALAATYTKLAAAEFMAAHAYIPFTGFAIGAGFATASTALIEASGVVGAFAEGGVVPGNSYVGDAVPILANSQEVILNASQQEMLAANLQSAQQNGGGGGRSTISGEQIVTVVNAYGRRTGRGEILR